MQHTSSAVASQSQVVGGCEGHVGVTTLRWDCQKATAMVLSRFS